MGDLFYSIFFLGGIVGSMGYPFFLRGIHAYGVFIFHFFMGRFIFFGGVGDPFSMGDPGESIYAGAMGSKVTMVKDYQRVQECDV